MSSDYDNRDQSEMIRYLEDRCAALRRELDAAHEVITKVSGILDEIMADPVFSAKFYDNQR